MMVSGEDERSGLIVEEDEFTEEPARNRCLVDLVAPFIGCFRVQVFLELHVGSTARARRRTCGEAQVIASGNSRDHSPMWA
jgi:hypothetical protein